jgi:hypothetical protein
LPYLEFEGYRQFDALEPVGFVAEERRFGILIDAILKAAGGKDCKPDDFRWIHPDEPNAPKSQTEDEQDVILRRHSDAMDRKRMQGAGG